MAAPDYVPVLPQDRPRRPEQLPPPQSWKPERPGDFADARPGQPTGPGLGAPGPDQGYALRLVKQFEDKLVLTADEHAHDVLAGAVEIAMRRSSMFGRAPVIHDLEVALRIFGFLSEAPADLVTRRKTMFAGVGHHYAARRRLVDAVDDSALRLPPAQVQGRLSDWKSLLK